jgi:monomeric sarcosine oxidase
LKRRDVIRGAVGGATALAAGRGAAVVPAQSDAASAGLRADGFDVAVVGAGVFGVWTAEHLLRAGRSVVLLDAWGPGHSRSSSGGETRLIRMSYGANELYTRWTLRSLEQWKALAAESGEPLFQSTGVVRLAPAGDRYVAESELTLRTLAVPFEHLDRDALAQRFPQIGLDGLGAGLLEPGSGILLARRGVQAAAERCRRRGASVLIDGVTPPAGSGPLAQLTTASGASVRARSFVFACGPWLPKIFPDLLAPLITVPRAEVFFLGLPRGDRRFAPPAMPAWIDEADDTYGAPDVDYRGFKIGIDPPPAPFDPDTALRVVPPESVERLRAYVRRRFPALAEAPVVETRVCQYEETASGDFLIDRHPGFTNVWIAGGGSGHGFKLGPALGEYVAERVIREDASDARFTLATHRRTPTRSVE